jgi:hypothetical protein
MFYNILIGADTNFETLQFHCQNEKLTKGKRAKADWILLTSPCSDIHSNIGGEMWGKFGY